MEAVQHSIARIVVRISTLGRASDLLRDRLTLQIILRIDDQSDMGSFAAAVSIPSYHIVGSSSSGYVAFRVLVTTTARAQLSILRRYSDFVALRVALRQAFPELHGAIARLPPKSATRKFTQTFLQRRRRSLELWLASCLLHPILGGSQVCKRWCLDDLG